MQNLTALVVVLFTGLPVAALAREPIDLGHPKTAPYAYTITAPVEIAARTEQFKKDFASIGSSAHLANCSNMVELAVGVVGGDFSYGAVCDLRAGGRRIKLLVCDDEMMGDFSLTSIFAISPDAVAKFTEQNC